MITITAVEFQRNFGRYQDTALTEPVAITHNGRERVVMLSVDEYHLSLIHISEPTRPY